MSPDAVATPDHREADEGQRELAVRIGLGLFASEAELHHLIAIARQIDVGAGQVLFERGQPVTTMFQLVDGDVELQAPERPAWRVAQRGAIGFLDFARHAVHERTAKVTRPAQLLELDASDYRDYLEDNYEVGQRIRDRLCEEVTASILATADPAPLLALDRGDGELDARSFFEIEIPVVDRLLMLSRMAPFRGASVQALANLAQCAAERRIEPGGLVTQHGTDPRMISLLVEGAIELELPTGRVARSGRGLVAHLEELAPGPRRTTAVATAPTIVLDIDRDDLIDRVEEHFDLGMTLLAFAAAEQARINDLTTTCRVA